MYTEKELKYEISEIVNGRIARDEPIPANWITLAIIKNHMHDFEHGKDYICYCLWHSTRKCVGDYLARQFKTESGNIQQRTLPGFEYVQQAYVVERQGDDVAVPTRLLSYDELTAIGERAIKRGRSEINHGREVLDLRDELYPNPQAA